MSILRVLRGSWVVKLKTDPVELGVYIVLGLLCCTALTGCALKSRGKIDSEVEFLLAQPH
jgi:hypothetical protein